MDDTVPPIKGKLEQIVGDIERTHEVAMERLLKDGKHIALERVFRGKIKEHYGVETFGFTDQERGNLSLLIRDLDTAVAPFLIEAVTHWRDLRAEKSLTHLPPTPVFKDLFFNRQRIQSCLSEIQARTRRSHEAIQKARDMEAQEEKLVSSGGGANPAPSPNEPAHAHAIALGPRRQSLVEMYKESLRQEREKKAAQKTSGGGDGTP